MFQCLINGSYFAEMNITNYMYDGSTTLQHFPKHTTTGAGTPASPGTRAREVRRGGPTDHEYCYDGERRFVVYNSSLVWSVKVWRLSEDRPLEPPLAVTESAAPMMPALLAGEQ